MKKLFTSVIILFLALNIIIPVLNMIPQLNLLRGYPLLLTIIVIMIMIIKVIWKPGISLTLICGLISYGIFAMIEGGHSQIRDYIIELLLLLVIISLSSILGDRFHHQFQTEGETSFATDQKVVYHYQQILTTIESEFARGFRYGFPIVLVRMRGINNKSREKICKYPFQQLDKLMVNFLANNIRMTDILARMDGPNNFLLICPGIETEEAELMIKRLTQLLLTRELIGFSHVIASFPKDGRSFDELFERLNQQSISLY